MPSILIPKPCFNSKNKLLIVIFALGILIRLVYLSYTPFNVRTYDVDVVGGHIDYIKFVEKNHRLPDVSQKSEQCWECYQRPLYYMTAASLYSSIKSDGNKIAYRCLQLYSLMLFSGFLFFGVLIFKRLFNDDFYTNIASSLLIFWPSGIIHSVRIGNEPMLYLFYAVGLFFIIKWYQENKNADIIVAAVFACLATLTKSTGIILFFVMLPFLGWKIWISKNKSAHFYSAIIILGIFFVSLTPVVKDLINVHLGNNDSGWRLAGNSWSLNEGLFVGNKLKNYTSFDVQDFLNVPYADTWHDAGGRQYFWNFLLKSSLFGEFRIDLPLNYFLATQMSAMLLIMAACIIGGLTIAKTKIDRGFHILFLNAILLLASLVYFRVNVPASCSNDFRFIFPSLFTFIALLVLAIKNLNVANYHKLARIGYVLVVIFIVFSVAFFINPFLMMIQRLKIG